METVGQLYGRSLEVMENLRTRSIAGREDGRHPPRLPITRVAELVGRTSAAIREAERMDGSQPFRGPRAVDGSAARYKRSIACVRS